MLVLFDKTDYLTEEQLLGFRACADSLRRAKADRCRYPADRALSLLADHLAREGIGTFLSVTPEAVSFSEDSTGKLRTPGCCFNISHSGQAVLCVVSQNEIGCDIEAYRAVSPALISRFTSEQEQAYIRGDSGRFLRVWTAKEAVLKCRGTGIRSDLRSFSVASEKGLFERFEDVRLICGEREGYLTAIAEQE